MGVLDTPVRTSQTDLLLKIRWMAGGVQVGDLVTTGFYPASGHASRIWEGEIPEEATFFEVLDAADNSVLYRSSLPAVSTGDPFSGPYPVTLRFEDADGDLVPGVTFTVPGLGTATAATGQRTIGLPEALDPDFLSVIASPTSGVLWEPLEIEVTEETDTITLIGTTQSLPIPSPNTLLCVVYVDLQNFTGKERGRLTITDLPLKLPSERWVVGESFGEIPDETGRITFPAVPRGATVLVEVEEAQISSTITTPNAETYKL